MKFNFANLVAIPAVALSMVSCNNSTSTTTSTTADTTVHQVTIKEEDVDIQADSVILKSVVAYNDDTTAKKPIVLIVPEWWGLDGYVKGRAKQLAELGYLAIGIDLYGGGKVGADPKAATELST